MPFAPSQRNLDERSRPSFCAGRQLGEVEQALLWTLLQEDPECPSRVLRDKVAKRHRAMAVSLRHRNRWRAPWQRNRHKGRPRQASCPLPVAFGAEVVRITPRLSCVGVHLCAHWLDQQGAFGPVVAQRKQAVEAHKHTHPDDDFALVHHREQTLRRRFHALVLAPLCGIDRLPAFETHEPPLPTRLGRGYHSATLRQFLGQRERVGAAEALRPALVAAPAGQIPSVDGPMIPSWSRGPMHKGKITMLGRIMGGSHAVIAHDEAGQALFVAYYPPDMPLSQVLVAYGQKVAEATGRTLCVIDRAVNAVAMAWAFDAQGLGLLCMLDDNAHQGLESVEATQVDTLEDGTKVSSGPWKGPRPDDPRHLVMVEPGEGKTLVSWATPKGEASLEVTKWPRGYRARNARQEHRFKRMIDHGALDTTYGRKKMIGADRQQQRAKATRDQSLAAAQQRVDKKAEAIKAQQAQGAASESQGHGTRLAQRQRALAVLAKAWKDAQHQQATWAEQAKALGPPGQRADRDCRKQTIMTVRTLLLEKVLCACMVALVGTLQTQVSLETILHLLFERSGARMETSCQGVSWVNTAGLSVSSRRLLTEVAEGLCAMGLRDHDKPICVRLKDMPP